MCLATVAMYRTKKKKKKKKKKKREIYTGINKTL